MNVTLRQGHVLDQLRELPENSVHCVVTSPPYWGLRDYGIEPQVWPDGWTGSYGLEPTIELYVQHTVEIFREVRRVLRKDGVCFLNLGDSYASSWASGRRSQIGNPSRTNRVDRMQPGLKEKDLCGIPWRIALALQEPYYTGKIKNEKDRVWLAAIIDGEGCLFIHKRKAGTSSGAKFTKQNGEEVEYNRTQDTFGAGLEVANCNQDIIKRCIEITGIGSICQQGPTENYRRKRILYRWNVRSNECRDIIREVYPYLVAKKHEARLLINCPSSGKQAQDAHESLKALHNGGEATIDFKEPESLYESGWYLRSDCIWAKLNPMPESVTDRPTRSHEYIFLLTKSNKYFWDQEAVREESQDYTNKHTVNEDGSKQIRKAWKDHKDRDSKKDLASWGSKYGSIVPANGRNLRSVWNIATQPFSGVAAYGTCRIASPDCPVHDYQADRLLVQSHDAQPDASDFGHNLYKRGRHAPRQEGAVVSIPLYQFGPLFDETFAIYHSRRSYKKEDELRQDVIFYDIPADRIECKALLDHCAAKFFHIPGYRNGQGVSFDEPHFDPSARTFYRIAGIVASGEPPSGCLCHYTGKVEMRQDHFAVFPDSLVEKCIKAGTSEKGVCPKCGVPWVRVVEKKLVKQYECRHGGFAARGNAQGMIDMSQSWSPGHNETTTIGWQPSCKCPSMAAVPAVILDPFSGSGTTPLVAAKLGRDAIGIELKQEYVDMAKKRLRDELGFLVEIL